MLLIQSSGLLGLSPCPVALIPCLVNLSSSLIMQLKINGNKVVSIPISTYQNLAVQNKMTGDMVMYLTYFFDL